MDPNSFFKLPLGIENLHFFQWKSMEKPYTFQDSPLRAGKIGNFYTEPVIEQRSEHEGRHFRIFPRMLLIVLRQCFTCLITE